MFAYITYTNSIKDLCLVIWFDLDSGICKAVLWVW